MVIHEREATGVKNVEVKRNLNFFQQIFVAVGLIKDTKTIKEEFTYTTGDIQGILKDNGQFINNPEEIRKFVDKNRDIQIADIDGIGIGNLNHQGKIQINSKLGLNNEKIILYKDGQLAAIERKGQLMNQEGEPLYKDNLIQKDNKIYLVGDAGRNIDTPFRDPKTTARDNWNRLINKFKAALIPEHELGKLNDAIVDSVRVKVVQQDRYLQEIAQGKHKVNLEEFNMLKMSSEERKTCQLSYNTSAQILLDARGRVATTIGKESKSMRDVQAFVMGKDGAIYIAPHKGVYEADKTIPNLTHASFLGGIPAETAGIIGINNRGKIDYLSNNSGHYQPEALDMYRAVKKIQETMPGALDKNCQIDIQGHPRIFVTDFIKDMETKVGFGKSAKTKHEKLRENRIEKIKNYQANLKNIAASSKPKARNRITNRGRG
ncbi:hypothetical protein RFEPED_1617 [Rickettsia felis str. Pedreira]|uniref:Uncharacterized protein n=1 Tax=Rickettsia felis str. Pedreira TaxID=1359196 RepID=A0A0F3MU69_RICFI|nr:hypothetical protein RFEPED_1617 [Rickettsia felis str. Pedreira]